MKRERHVIITTELGLAIIALPHNAQHSNQVGVAPDGFSPGDEKFIKLIADESGNRHLLFDFQGKWAQEHERQQARSTTSDWNGSGPIARIKKSFLG
jgi:hypothetical protein